MGRKNLGRSVILFVVSILALGLIPAERASAAPLCFEQPGVTACVADEFRAFWESNGGLSTFGYPLEAAKQEQTPEGTFTVQYFERQRLELHPDMAAPYNILLGRANDEVLRRESRDWRAFPKAGSTAAGCTMFAETGHSVCGLFLRRWLSQGLEMGDSGVSYRESLALWGLPLSEPQEELNIDGDTVLTQHFERARMEVHSMNGSQMIMLTRVGAALVPLTMKLFGVNDFHGQLPADRRVSNRPAGGAAFMAAYLKQRRQQTPYSLTVHAGDMIGASPLVSAVLQDQPTMDFLNTIGFDVGTPGNHEFDEGITELKRLVEGGCHPAAGCWGGATFPYISSNVFDTATGKTIFPPYLIKNVAGARIGFVGAVLKGTPEVVTPSGVAGLEFRDEAASINAAVVDLKKQGVHAIVVLIHQGGTQDPTTKEVTGPIVDIVNAIDDDVDVVVSGHTHSSLNAVIDGKLVTQAFSYSTAFADIDLTIDRAKRDIVAKKAEIVTTFNDTIEPDAEIAALVKKYQDQSAPLANRVVGTLAEDLPNEQNEAGESAIGNLIADAQRAEMGTQFAFMNPGGIRAPLAGGEVTYGELFAVQPFGNNLVKMNLTGDQVYALLNQQWQPQTDGSVRTRFLQISGLTYTWSEARPVGDRVVEIRGADGQPIDRAATYSVTVNAFLADGGDAFTILREGTNRVGGPIDLDALVNYITAATQPFTAKIEGRITKQ